jgi:dienelactone hydrolase
MDTPPTFDDLLLIRTGGPSLTMGSGPSRLERLATLQQWQTKAEALRLLFRQTLGCPPDLDCPLDPELVEEIDGGDYWRRTLAFQVAPGERIAAYVLVPKGLTGRVPGVLCIHPTSPLGKEQTIGADPSQEGQNRAYGLHLVRRGYVTLTYDLLSAGTRRYPGLKDFDTAPFSQQYPAWSVRGKDLQDARRAVDLLQTLEEVDPARLGAIGHSQGGGITIHAMALDERLKAGVSSCGDWPARLSRNPFNHARTAWWVGRPFLRPYCLTGKPFPIDLHEYLALAAPRAIMNIVALDDWMYSLDEEAFTRAAWENLEEHVREVFALCGAAENFQNLLHTQGHGFSQPQRDQAYAFLDRHLQGGCPTRDVPR